MSWRIAEIFGPTIQGEGRNVGVPCHFVRFGGCDFRCTWCDTPHAVLPELVNKLPKMTEWEILAKLRRLDGWEFMPTWIVLTGGNPGLLNISELIRLLHVQKRKVMLETQGSTYRDWYHAVDDLCFSPKPPSSEMKWDFDLFSRILSRMALDYPLDYLNNPPYLKVPVFTYADLDFAEEVHKMWPDLEMFISIGNDDEALPTVGNPHPEVQPSLGNARWSLLDNFKEWTEVVLSRQALADCKVFPQQHVLLWGNTRGH